MSHPPRQYLAGLLLVAAGCRTTYVEDTAGARRAFADGRFEEAYRALAEAKPAGRDRVVYHLERAVVAHTTGDWARSNVDLEEARKLVGIDEEAGVGRRIGGTAATFLLDETAGPYPAEDYEQVLIPALKCVNHLLAHDPGDVHSIDRAYAAARASAELQKWLATEHDRELADADREAKSGGLRRDALLADLRPRYEAQFASLRGRANLFQNAFAHYLSALVLEMTGKTDAALIAAEKAYALDPGFSYLRDDLLRLSAAGGDAARGEKYRALFGAEPRAPGKDEGEAVVVYECGLAPLKEELAVRFPVPAGRGRLVWVKLVFPVYAARFNPSAFAALRAGDREARTEPLMDVEALAILSLRDRMPILATKMLLRAGAKAAAQIGLQEGGRRVGGRDGGGLLGLLLGILYAELSERADLRSWLTLPRSFQVARMTLPAGPQALSLRVCDAGGGTMTEIPLGTWEIRPGAKRFILLRTVGERSFAVVGRYATERAGAN